MNDPRPTLDYDRPTAKRDSPLWLWPAIIVIASGLLFALILLIDKFYGPRLIFCR